MMFPLVTAEEVWAPVVDLPGYEVSSAGRVRSIDRRVANKWPGTTRFAAGRILRPIDNGNGYIVFHTTKESRNVAREVLRAFVGEPPSAGIQACHGDGNKKNNTLTNLRWDTQIGNEADKLLHGTRPFGERHHACKLTNAQVAVIKEDGRKHREIAGDFGVSRSHISSIKCGYFRRNG